MRQPWHNKRRNGTSNGYAKTPNDINNNKNSGILEAEAEVTWVEARSTDEDEVHGLHMVTILTTLVHRTTHTAVKTYDLKWVPHQQW